MVRRSEALAYQVDFDAPEQVSEVYADPLPADGDNEFCDADSIVDMIEEERCPLADPGHSDGMHVYLNRSNRCARCDTAAPWMRHACRS